ncbi:MAG: phytanoyl-CoA dioxygenase family protein [Planctomycetes bacterium]|nr:phytanoyl-CoA dioxygenase family protein [Planctomycetota bacterium]
MDFKALTPAQKRQFYAEGYLIVRGALDPQTVARLIEAGDRLCASERLENRQRSADGLFDGFRNVVSLDDAFLPLLTWPATVPLIVQLFGPRIHLATSHLIYKHPDPPGTPRTKRCPGWHRDIMYTPEDLGHAHIPRMEMKCAYYLTDLSEPDSGATLLAPGSNHAKARIVIDPRTHDPANALEPSLRPGDAVFFENRTWHAGGANLSGRIRKAVMFGYSFRWVKPMDYEVQPRALTERVDPIGKQLLGATADPAGRFVPGGSNEPLIEWCRNHGVTYEPAA